MFQCKVIEGTGMPISDHEALSVAEQYLLADEKLDDEVLASRRLIRVTEWREADPNIKKAAAWWVEDFMEHKKQMKEMADKARAGKDPDGKFNFEFSLPEEPRITDGDLKKAGKDKLKNEVPVPDEMKDDN